MRWYKGRARTSLAGVIADVVGTEAARGNEEPRAAGTSLLSSLALGSIGRRYLGRVLKPAHRGSP